MGSEPKLRLVTLQIGIDRTHGLICGTARLTEIRYTTGTYSSKLRRHRLASSRFVGLL